MEFAQEQLSVLLLFRGKAGGVRITGNAPVHIEIYWMAIGIRTSVQCDDTNIPRLAVKVRLRAGLIPGRFFPLRKSCRPDEGDPGLNEVSEI